MIIIAEVSELTRKIKLPTDRVLSVNGDYQVDGIAFKLPATYEGDFDFSTAAARVHWTGVDKVEHTNLITEVDGNGYPLWVMPSELTQGGHGVIEFAVSFVATDATAAVTKRWISDPVSFRNRRTVNGSNEDEEAEEEKTYDRLASAIAAVRAAQASVDDVAEVLSSLGTLTFHFVDAKADMTDQTKLYVLTTDGYLYYYSTAASDFVPAFEVGGSQEVIDARTDENGTTYANLKTRINTGFTQLKEDLSDEIGDLKDAFGEYSETAYITPAIDSIYAGVTAFTEADGTLRLYGTPTEYRRFACLCGQKAIKFSTSPFEKTLDAGVYKITSSVSGYKDTFQWVYTYTTFADQQTLIDTSSPSKTVVFTQPVMIGLQFATNQNWGTVETPTRITFSAEKLSAKDPVARSEIDTIKAWKYNVGDQIDAGTMNIESGTSGNAYSSFWRYRKQARMVRISAKPVTISFPDVNANSITTIRIYKYSEIDGVVTFIGHSSPYSLTNGRYTYIPENGVNIIKVTITPNESSYNDFGRIAFHSEEPLEIVYNHGIGNSDYEGNITFAYIVSGNTYTSGQMILPPNYKISGNPVPLYVNVHGTGPMATWTDIFAETGTTTKQRNRDNYMYMANEGFAVLDLYPWTSKYYSADNQVSPINITTHQRAFIEGIKYVCSHYNIDINNVGMSFKSLGGNLGHFFMHQTEIPIRAMAMLAPSTSYMSTVWNTLFLLNSDGGIALRSRVVEILGLTGETNAQLFIETDRGMNNENVMQFVRNHIDKFAHLNIAGFGVNGATLSDIFEWSFTGVATLPQWLQDKGFTTIASKWTTSPARGVPSVINHPDLSKHSNVPVKFWQAPDDVNTSFHVNYTIYQWLLNGGTDVDFRILPENTGGHHAIDTDTNALKSSGTTRLGIAYTGIATTYVEMADFFYNKMVL